MANPRNKQGKSNDTSNEEVAVSDTSTEATEATPEAPTAEAPKEPKPVIDHEGNLSAAILTFASSTDENKVATLQEAYRAVPAAARGKVQGVAMKAAMTGGVEMDVLSEVLDAFNNLPTASKSTRTKSDLPPEVAGAIRLAALMVAYPAAKAVLGEDADALAKVWHADGTPPEHLDAVLRLATSVIKATEKGGRGGSGERTSKTETLKDLLADGRIAAGSVLKGAGDAEATVNEDGTISTKGESFDNPSAAARAHRITAENPKGTSTNGWDFWTLDGKAIGELRVK